jgi:hypothetical protein
MNKIEFGFGVGKNKNNEVITDLDRESALAVIRKEAAAVFGGYTLFSPTGGWRNPAGVLVEEPGYTLMVLVSDANNFTIDCFAAYIRGAFQQEAVVVTITPVTFRFV